MEHGVEGLKVHVWLRSLKPEGFVLPVLLSWQRLQIPRMRAGSLGSSPASTSSVRSSGQWSAMVLGAPHSPWWRPHPPGPSPGQTHRGSRASTLARARRCALSVYGLRARVRRLSLAFLHLSHREPEETRSGQPGVEHTFHISGLHPWELRAGVEPTTLRRALFSCHWHSKNHGAMAGKVSVLGICAIPCALPLSYRSWI